MGQLLLASFHVLHIESLALLPCTASQLHAHSALPSTAPPSRRRVQGLDATAARSFVTLHRRLQRMGIQLAVAHIPAPCAHIRGLLEAQGLALVQPPDAGTGDGCPALVATGGGAPTSPTACLCFPTMESAVQHAEEAFLAVAVSHGLCQPQARRLTLAQVGDQTPRRSRAWLGLAWLGLPLQAAERVKVGRCRACS